SGPPPCSHVPVKSKGGLGRGFARLAGGKASKEPRAWEFVGKSRTTRASPYATKGTQLIRLIFNFALAPPKKSTSRGLSAARPLDRPRIRDCCHKRIRPFRSPACGDTRACTYTASPARLDLQS